MKISLKKLIGKNLIKLIKQKQSKIKQFPEIFQKKKCFNK